MDQYTLRILVHTGPLGPRGPVWHQSNVDDGQRSILAINQYPVFHISIPHTLAHTLARRWARSSGRAAVVARWLYIIWAYKVVMGCYEGVMGCHKNVMVCYEGVRRRSHTLPYICTKGGPIPCFTFYLGMGRRPIPYLGRGMGRRPIPLSTL